MKEERRCYILGDPDAEMSVIETLLTLYGKPFFQARTTTRGYRGYPVGPTPSQLGLTINGLDVKDEEGIVIPVFVECTPPPSWPKGTITEFVPDPGDLPTVLEVLDDLLAHHTDVHPSPQLLRWIEIVAAHDHHGYEGLLAVGASPEERNSVRALSAMKRGLSPNDYSLAEEIVAAAGWEAAAILVDDVGCAPAVVQVLQGIHEARRAQPPGILLISGSAAVAIGDVSSLVDEEIAFDPHVDAPAGVDVLTSDEGLSLLGRLVDASSSLQPNERARRIARKP